MEPIQSYDYPILDIQTVTDGSQLQLILELLFAEVELQ
jgi:hypothetical protein